MKIGSLQMRVVLYCAHNVQAKLTSAAIARQFSFERQECVPAALRKAVEVGYLERFGPPHRAEFGAGPRLLQLVRGVAG